ncbi:SDR family NAD(P)-dependent oxidoreductase [Emcibacter sp.]|uniref:SDR family NAD(P)-dependent oxidoreductase n=1 Tax=Emcibacter sp. TaxID=1979954 RepID=UPI002AA95F71|nr:SDR family NAD(P)-dependent oxidoreductase [Emcibacter sp.]
MSDFSLTGKHIIVTGASSGIGLGSAKVMAGLGAKVMLVARREDKLAQAVEEIRRAGGEAGYYAADMSVRDQVNASIDAAEEVFGPVDGLFANAGAGGPRAPITEYTDEAFDDIMTLNLKSLFWAMKRVLPSMIERRDGAILATGSLASERGFPNTVGYNASKHAVLGMVRSAAAEVARHNIRVNCILPGVIESEMLGELADQLGNGNYDEGLKIIGQMSPQGRVGTSEELGNVAAFLLSDAARYVNGQAWSVDGGILGTIATGG